MSCSSEWDFVKGVVSHCRVDFNLLFEFSVLTILPCCLIIICALLRICFLQLSAARDTRPLTASFVCKCCVASLTIICRLIALIGWNTFQNRQGYFKSTVAASAVALELCASITTLIWQSFEQVKSSKTSRLVACTYLVQVICDAIRLRTFVLVSLPIRGKLFFFGFLASYLLLCLQLIVEVICTDGDPAIDNSHNILSDTFLLWFWPLMMRGVREKFTITSLPRVLQSSELDHEAFEREWKKTTINPAYKRPLLRALYRVYRFQMLSPVILLLVSLIFNMANPLILKVLLQFLYAKTSSNPRPPLAGYFIGILYVIAFFMSHLLRNRAKVSCIQIGSAIRGVLMQATYRKALKAHQSTMAEVGPGSLSSFMSIDLERITLVADLPLAILELPLAYLLGLLIIWQEFDWIASVCTAVVVVVSSVALPFTANLTTKAQTLWSEATDRRVRFIASVLKCMRTVKFSHYEPLVMQRQSTLRKTEVATATKFRMRYITCGFTYNIVWVLFRCVVFVSFSISSGSLSVIPSVVVIAVLTAWDAPFFEIVWNFGSALAARSSFQRIEAFLMMHEKSVSVSPLPKEKQNETCKEIVFENAYFGTKEVSILKNLNLHIPIGKLIMIVGSTGSGKTSLINAILGEMDLLQGTLSVPRCSKMSYCPQDAFTRRGFNIKDNILFMSPFNSKRYQEAVEACDLQQDFESIPDGDEGPAHELSGGQQQRINLARCSYADADINLLDDCFSALDPITEEVTFTKLFGDGGLLRGKTNILATNACNRFPQADYVVFLSNGEISGCGSFRHMIDNSSGFVDLIASAKHRSVAVHSKTSLVEAEASISKMENLVGDEIDMETECQHGGTWKAVYLCLKSCGRLLNAQMTCYLFLAWPMFTIGFNLIILQGWIPAAEKGNRQWNWMLALCLSSALYLVAAAGWWITTVSTAPAVVGTDILHRATAALLNSRSTGVHLHSAGYYLNRLSMDLYMTEVEFVRSLSRSIQLAVFLLSIAAVTLQASYYNIISIFAFGIFIEVARRFYGKTSVQLRRLESAAKTPIYTTCDELNDGNALTTFRCFDKQSALLAATVRAIERSNAPYVLLRIAALWLRMFANVFSLIVIAILVFVGISTDASTQNVALGLVQALILPTIASEFLQFASLTDMTATSVHRLQDLVDFPAASSDDALQPSSNFSKLVKAGQISFRNVSLRYRETGSLALDDVSFDIRAGQIVGICGRTGSGKSTTLAALFRMADISHGNITIDGQPISAHSLYDLRSSMSIIPQDPAVFAMSLRENIDPEGTATDQEIWDALDRCHCKEMAQKVGLEYEMPVTGGCFSKGYLQLIALTRAYLRKRKILCLDEASASLDPATDQAVQKTLRTAFPDCTLLVVAHRISTICDLDWIIVLDKGRIVEQGVPQELLCRPDGYFRKLAGEAEEAKL